MEEGQRVRLRALDGGSDFYAEITGIYLGESRLMVHDDSGSTWILRRNQDHWIRLGRESESRFRLEAIEK